MINSISKNVDSVTINDDVYNIVDALSIRKVNNHSISITFRDRSSTFLEYIDYIDYKSTHGVEKSSIDFNYFMRDMHTLFEVLYIEPSLSGVSEQFVTDAINTKSVETKKEVQTLVSTEIEKTNISVYNKLEQLKVDFPKPLLHSNKLNIYGLGKTKKFIIDGSYITEDTIIEVGDLDVTTEFLNSNSICLTVTSKEDDTLGQRNVVCKNKYGESIYNSFFELYDTNWIDLRLGGSTFSSGTTDASDIILRQGMSLQRDEQGIYFTGIQRWKTFARFDFLKWNRKLETKTVEWVMTRAQSAMMIGIGSGERNVNSNSQYKEHDMMAYFNSPSSFWGLFSNSGKPNQYKNFGERKNTPIDKLYKIRIENNGDKGSIVLITMIDIDSDWDSEGVILTKITIPSHFNPIAEYLSPTILPFSGNKYRILGVKVE